MLVELALWLTAPVSFASRRSGLLWRSVALWSRATRRRQEWEPHLARARAVVEEAISDLPNRRKVVVLGSGLLQDVPMPALLAAFDTVVLVDAAHLLPVRLRHRGHPKVVFVERDLCGFPQAGAGRIPPLADFAADPSVDFVVSANMLSQLPLPYTAREPPGLGRRIVQGHLDDLARFRARVCLMTDVRYEDVGPGGIVGDSVDMMEGVSLPPPDQSWTWDVSPRGEEDAVMAYRHIVHAWRDFNEAMRQRQKAPGDADGPRS